MSKGSRQALTLVATVAGIYEWINDNLAEGFLQELLDKAHLETSTCLQRYDETGDPLINRHYVKIVLRRWRSDVLAEPEIYTKFALVQLSHMILTDLIMVTNNKEKLKLLLTSLAAVQAVFDYVDPDRTHYDAYDVANKILNKLYSYIEFFRT